MGLGKRWRVRACVARPARLRPHPSTRLRIPPSLHLAPCPFASPCPHPQGGYLPPRVVNLLLQYVTQALAFSHTWKALKPHVEQLLTQ